MLGVKGCFCLYIFIWFDFDFDFCGSFLNLMTFLWLRWFFLADADAEILSN